MKIQNFIFVSFALSALVGCNNGSLLSEDCLASAFKAHEGHDHEEGAEAPEAEADEAPPPPPCDPEPPSLEIEE